jgi:Fur family iron response transcriptional regulator
MLREVVVDALSSYFDTNVSHHHHFFCEEDRNLVDIPGEELKVVKLPHPPPGTTATEVDKTFFPLQVLNRIHTSHPSA